MFLIRWRLIQRHVAAAVLCAALPVGSARADFISDLLGIFKPPEQAAPVAATARPTARAKVRVASRHPVATSATRAAGPKPPVALLTVLKERGAREAFLADPTLRSGDLVVTETGISLFSGSHGAAHSLTDFRPVAMSTLRNRSSLIELERVSGLLRRQRPTMEAAAPVEMPLTVSLSRRSADESTAAPDRCVSADSSCRNGSSFTAEAPEGATER